MKLTSILYRFQSNHLKLKCMSLIIYIEHDALINTQHMSARTALLPAKHASPSPPPSVHLDPLGCGAQELRTANTMVAHSVDVTPRTTDLLLSGDAIYDAF